MPERFRPAARSAATAWRASPWLWALPVSLGLTGCANVKLPEQLVGGGGSKPVDRPAAAAASPSTSSSPPALPVFKTREQRLAEQRERVRKQMAGDRADRLPVVVNGGRAGVPLPPLQTRDQRSLAQLFAKKTVTGTDLVTELKAVRQLLQNKGVAALATGLMGDPSSPEEVGKQPSLMDQMKGAVIEAGLSALDSGSSGSMFSSSLSAMREHLSALIDDSGSMSQETITLPDVQGMTPRQMQKTVNLAAMTVATRVSGRMLKKAQEDFKGIEAEYAELIDRREKAATALYGLLSQGEASQDVKGSFSAGDLEFLRARVSSMSLAQFSTDMGVQQLALNHLKKTDPQTWQDYSRKSGRAIKGTQGVVKTLTGVASFGAMASYVGRDVVSMAKRRQYADLVRLGPILASFATEAAPLLSYSVEAAYSGVEVALKPTKRYRVQSGDSTEEISSAHDLFALLSKQGADPALQAALFRNDAPGLLYRLYQCDAAQAGQMLDAAVEPTVREQFFSDYRVAGQVDPSFAQSLARKTSGSSSLGEDLLQRDHRERTDQRSRPIAELQKVIAGDGGAASEAGYRNWGDEQLLRLIFVNREGSAQHAALQLGSLTIRPVPTAQSIYAYETLVDGCRRHMAALDVDGPDVKAGARPAKGTKAGKPAQPVKSDGPAAKGGAPQG